MLESILQNTRVACNLDANDGSFDEQLMPLINAEILELMQIGVGSGYLDIGDESVTFRDINPSYPSIDGSIATVIGQSVRLVFDPPSSSMANEAIKNIIDKAMWRITSVVDYNKTV